MSTLQIAIMQPTYLPWAGYLSMISRSDLFVFLDDVQFNKNSWQRRNKILSNGKVLYLSVPAKSHQETLIKDVLIDDSHNWRSKHSLSIERSYGKLANKACIKKILNIIKDEDIHLLSDLNIQIIRKINEILDITTPIELASNLGLSGKKSQHLLNICQYYNATVYLSAPGSQQYIEEEGIFLRNNFNVKYHHFTPAPYKQKSSSEFISHMSIIDVLSHLDVDETKKYIQ